MKDLTKLTDQLDIKHWDKINNENFPFLSHHFHKALKDSNCIGESKGWIPVYIKNNSSLLFSFIKNHSYGEYIFDWDWANFYDEYNLSYYPKLTSMIPFTSVTTSHFVGKSSEDLMNAYLRFYEENDFSSSHFLFLKKEEISFFEKFNYIIRDSFQYHFFNKGYNDFDSFLAALKNKKAKQIKKERTFPSDIEIKRISGASLTKEHGEQMYGFYLETIHRKKAIPYLNKGFFMRIFETLKDHILYVQAKKNNTLIAGSLYFFSDESLYGRYWGAVESIPNLHFELCYYQGIDFCIEKGLPVFEAGAQGEHKISRGFKPVKTYSAHRFKHPKFHQAIKQYIKEERINIESLMFELDKKLPFR